MPELKSEFTITSEENRANQYIENTIDGFEEALNKFGIKVNKEIDQNYSFKTIYKITLR